MIEALVSFVVVAAFGLFMIRLVRIPRGETTLDVLSQAAVGGRVILVVAALVVAAVVRSIESRFGRVATS